MHKIEREIKIKQPYNQIIRTRRRKNNLMDKNKLMFSGGESAEKKRLS